MKKGNWAGLAPSNTRARKRDDERWRADATRDMPIQIAAIAGRFQHPRRATRYSVSRSALSVGWAAGHRRSYRKASSKGCRRRGRRARARPSVGRVARPGPPALQKPVQVP